ncbi:hypothetical protein Tco_0972457 [Tanacetum coccineum]
MDKRSPVNSSSWKSIEASANKDDKLATDPEMCMVLGAPLAPVTSKMDMGLLEWSIEGRRVYVCTTRKGFMFSDHQKRYYLLREKLYLDCVKHGPPRAWIADSDGAEKQWRLYGFSALSLK